MLGVSFFISCKNKIQCVCVSCEKKKKEALKKKKVNDTTFIAALFTTAKTWKQPKCSSTQEWIKKMWYICTMDYYSAIKKNKIMPFAGTWMDLESIILSEVSQTEKDKYHMMSLIVEPDF